MKTIEIYKNYGCLAAEKRTVYTYGFPQETAVCSEKILVEIPEGWEYSENYLGEPIISSPWTPYNYLINDVLEGDEYPYFSVVSDDGKTHRTRLKEIKE